MFLGNALFALLGTDAHKRLFITMVVVEAIGVFSAPACGVRCSTVVHVDRSMLCHLFENFEVVIDCEKIDRPIRKLINVERLIDTTLY